MGNFGLCTLPPACQSCVRTLATEGYPPPPPPLPQIHLLRLGRAGAFLAKVLQVQRLWGPQPAARLCQ
jgi:hypothetical protein